MSNETYNRFVIQSRINYIGTDHDGKIRGQWFDFSKHKTLQSLIDSWDSKKKKRYIIGITIYTIKGLRYKCEMQYRVKDINQ